MVQSGFLSGVPRRVVRQQGLIARPLDDSNSCRSTLTLKQSITGFSCNHHYRDSQTAYSPAAWLPQSPCIRSKASILRNNRIRRSRRSRVRCRLSSPYGPTRILLFRVDAHRAIRSRSRPSYHVRRFRRWRRSCEIIWRIDRRRLSIVRVSSRCGRARRFS